MHRRRATAPLAALVAFVSLGAGCARSHSASSAPANGEATISRVVDGDTVVASVQGRKERVRLIGIDTPESVKPNTPVQCFAIEASDHTKQLLPPGTKVRLEGDVDRRDRYGRLLAYVYRQSDNLFVNLALARDGYAVQDTIPPNVAHASDFSLAVAAARHAGRGLWSKCGSQIPQH